jgi:hypothetical protein
MKKIALVLSLFLTACAFGTNNKTENDKVEFKNPIFYQPLKRYWYSYNVRLTPTSVDFREDEDEDSSYYKAKCQLIRNQIDRITLKCKGVLLDIPEYSIYITYVLNPVFDWEKKCILIFEYRYDEPDSFYEDANEATTYCIKPPVCKIPESK